LNALPVKRLIQRTETTTTSSDVRERPSAHYLRAGLRRIHVLHAYADGHATR